jgi:hypothetical protein
MSYVTRIILLFTWMSGIVLAKSGWLTVAACAFPPYAVYLVVEKALKVAGWVA